MTFSLLPSMVQAAVSIQLKESVQLKKRTILLGDIASLNCNIESDCVKLRDIQVASLPRPGFKLKIGQQDINKLIRQYDRRIFSQLTWQGIADTIITPATQSLAMHDLIEQGKLLLTQQFPNDQPAISYVGSNEAILIPSGEITIKKARVAGVGLHSKMVTSFDIFVDDQYARTINLSFDISIPRTGWVSKQELSSNVSVSCSQFQQQTVDATTMPDMVTSCNDTIQLKQPLAAGQVLRESHRYIPPAVSQGSNVTLSIHAGNVMLESGAIALADGQVGQIIQVKPIHGTAPVAAKIVRPGMLTAIGTQWKN
ncbi:flagellar basal body P-ring formation chaperone FlgA [Chitinivorax sp. B]|uniref:flagellar basal body P-ring formation chaperone FlgA n=1 Tax=Chitinivorax sp. B TaxID=2502235 RepID=UPI001485B7E7|nr:flagellar basal body P-ring formation chaperone FlgA [Chitinivorax sp. B]